MSQSDYLSYKKNKHQLKEQSKLPAVIDHTSYIKFMEYQLSNTIINTKPTLNQLSNSNRFYSVPINHSNCPTFIECTNTNNRPNRVVSSNSTPLFGRVLLFKKEIPYTNKYCICN